MAKQTTSNKSRVIPEKMETTAPAPKVAEKEIKIKMLRTYISNEHILKENQIATIPSALANELIKNGEAERC